MQGRTGRTESWNRRSCSASARLPPSHFLLIWLDSFIKAAVLLEGDFRSWVTDGARQKKRPGISLDNCRLIILKALLEWMLRVTRGPNGLMKANGERWSATPGFGRARGRRNSMNMWLGLPANNWKWRRGWASTGPCRPCEDLPTATPGRRAGTGRAPRAPLQRMIQNTRMRKEGYQCITSL